MQADALGPISPPQPPKRTLLGFVIVAALAAAMLIGRAYVDILVVLVVCLLLGALERTLGDWLVEALGDRKGSYLFAAVLATTGWYLFGTEAGRNAALTVFRTAETRGSQDAYSKGLGGPSGPEYDAGRWSDTPGSVPRVDVSPFRMVTPSPDVAESSPGVFRAPAQALPVDRTALATTVRASIELLVSPLRIQEDGPVSVATKVTAGGIAVAGGAVDVTVDGILAARLPLGIDGRAGTPLVGLQEGVHTIRARYIGSRRYAPATSGGITVNVLPQ